MCIIIERNPHFGIPYEDFESAIHVNPDGYGIAVPDGEGKLTVLRSHEKPDPQEFYDLINGELIDKKLLIHLRYTTVGKTELRNAHPFPVLEHRTHGVDIRMAHNGTIHKYKPKATSDDRSSDTRAFVRDFVRPLFSRLIMGFTSEEILSDPFVEHLLSEQIPSTSVLSFIDGYGNTMTIHETGNGGKREEEWWYSNTYSFNRKHREPVQRSPYLISDRTGYDGYDYWSAADAYPGRSNLTTDPIKPDENKRHKVFVWDNLKNREEIKQLLFGAEPATIHGLAVTARKFLPLYNIGGGVEDFDAYLLDKSGRLKLPEYAQGDRNNLVGKVYEVDGIDMFDLDLHYTGSGEFIREKIAVKTSPLSDKYIQAWTWVTDPESVLDRRKLEGPNVREGLDFTPFSTVTRHQLYKF